MKDSAKMRVMQPKYKMRVEEDKTKYDRSKSKLDMKEGYEDECTEESGRRESLQDSSNSAY